MKFTKEQIDKIIVDAGLENTVDVYNGAIEISPYHELRHIKDRLSEDGYAVLSILFEHVSSME